jgi:hypothetical protein
MKLNKGDIITPIKPDKWYFLKGETCAIGFRKGQEGWAFEIDENELKKVLEEE